MLPRKLIDTALKGLPKAKVVTMQRQNFLAANGVEHPVRQFDFERLKPPVAAVFAANRGGVNQAEAVPLLLVAGANVRRDARARKTINRLAQRVVTRLCASIAR